VNDVPIPSRDDDRQGFNEALAHYDGPAYVRRARRVQGAYDQILDECRRRVQNATLGHRGRKPDPLYRCRRLPTTAALRPDVNGSAQLLGLLPAACRAHGDQEPGSDSFPRSGEALDPEKVTAPSPGSALINRAKAARSSSIRATQAARGAPPETGRLRRTGLSRRSAAAPGAPSELMSAMPGARALFVR